MRRVITQIGQSIYEWLFTRQAQDNMVALAKLSAAVLGTSTQFNGLAVSPTSPASMQVSVAPGEIYMLAALEGTIYGTLAADTTHQIVKQGISLDASLLTLTAPSVAGQSINYLIQATFQETDISVDPTSGTSPVVLQFYNDSNPTVPYSGPNNSGATSDTFRQGSVVLSAKAGISATTGSQVTPAPDAGYVGIAVVTVANGQTSITSGNITAYAGAPAINSTLLGNSPVFNVPVQVGQAVSALQAVQFGQVSGVVGQMRNLAMNISSASATANGYNVIVGSTPWKPILFTSYADHPRRLIALNPTLSSTAAGRYQLLARWFDAYKKQLNLPDFSPASQDAIALQQIKEQGALADIDAGRFDIAVSKVRKIWASLPGAGYGQRENKLEILRAQFAAAGGMLA